MAILRACGIIYSSPRSREIVYKLASCIYGIPYWKAAFRISIQDLQKNRYGSSPTFDKDPDPGKWYGSGGSGSAILLVGRIGWIASASSTRGNISFPKFVCCMNFPLWVKLSGVVCGVWGEYIFQLVLPHPSLEALHHSPLLLGYIITH